MSTKQGTAAGYIDLLNILDNFLTTTGHCWGLTFSGTGNGRLTGYLGTASSVVETITVTATSPTSFTVVGSVSGALGTATVGTLYSGTRCTFTIVAGATPFAAGAVFTFNTSPKWTQLREAGVIEIAKRTGSFANVQRLFDGQRDATSEVVQNITMPAWIQIECEYPSVVKNFSIGTFTSGRGPSAFTLQHSDDGVTWTTLHTYTGVTGWTTEELRYYQTTAAPSKRFWRVNITTSQGATLELSEVRFYGDAAGSWELDQRVEFAWKAPGVDGTKEIFVPGWTYTDSANDQWNIVFDAFRYWPGVLTDQSVRDVTPKAGGVTLPLTKNNFQYWIVAHGGRFILAVRVSGVYMFAYAGFGLPYETPAEHPYPAMVGAPRSIEDTRFNSTAGEFRNPCDPGVSCLKAFAPDGTWKAYGNREDSTGAEGTTGGSGNGEGVTWPYAFAQDGSQETLLRDSIDGSKPILPVILTHYSPEHVWGEFDGVYWTTGFGNAAEALMRDGAVDLLVFPNTYRTSIYSFCAIALD
jgi:hypothetical protein